MAHAYFEPGHDLHGTSLDLRTVIRRIQELATDTPSAADRRRNLDLIYRECESALINELP